MPESTGSSSRADAGGAGNAHIRRRGAGSLRTAVVAALVEQPGHGYELTNRLNRRMGPVLQTDSRRVYEVLEQLEKEGLAHCVEERVTGTSHRRRRVFSATALCHKAYAAWFAEREPLPVMRADIYALVAFSDPAQAERLLAKLDDYELDCLKLRESAVETDMPRGSWRSRMLGVTRVAAIEHVQGELRWITRVRREIEEYRVQAR